MATGDGIDDPTLIRFCTDLHPRLLGALVLMTGDVDVAEDLAQEALVRVCERWAQVRAMDNPEGWAFRVAANLARSRWRRLAVARRALPQLGRVIRGEATDPDVVTRDWVRNAVAALPRRQREVVALRWFAELSVAEAAAVMGCAEGTVKSLTAKATAALRVALDEHDEGAS